MANRLTVGAAQAFISADVGENVAKVAQFVEERCELHPDHSELKSQIYARFQEWAEDAGIRRVCSKRTFMARLEALGCDREPGGSHKKGKMIGGISLL